MSAVAAPQEPLMDPGVAETAQPSGGGVQGAESAADGSPGPAANEQAPQEVVAPSPRRPGGTGNWEKQLVPAKPKPWAGKQVSQQMYDAAWVLWRDGLRSRQALADRIGVSWETAKRIVDDGYPDRGWPALLERAKLHDRQVMEQKARLEAERAREQADEHFKSRKENLQLAKAAKVGMSRLAKLVLEAAATCKFSRTKKVIKDGAEVEIEVPPHASEVTKAAKELASAIRDLGTFEAYWLGEQQDLPGGPSKLDNVDEQQLKYIIESGGQLPPGLSDADLKG